MCKYIHVCTHRYFDCKSFQEAPKGIITAFNHSFLFNNDITELYLSFVKYHAGNMVLLFWKKAACSSSCLCLVKSIHRSPSNHVVHNAFFGSERIQSWRFLQKKNAHLSNGALTQMENHEHVHSFTYQQAELKKLGAQRHTCACRKG